MSPQLAARVFEVEVRHVLFGIATSSRDGNRFRADGVVEVTISDEGGCPNFQSRIVSA